MTPPSIAVATSVVEKLVASGVTDVVLCPGSRSAPLAYAVQAADRAGRLRLHVRVDERSAAFLALGLGKVTGRPAVVITTSGTAVANLHPAVLEAHHACAPLLVLSADRPAQLRGTGANQTTTQPGMYAGALRFEVDLDADIDPVEAAAQVRQAVGAAMTGPSHVNLQLREPLVPDLTDPALATLGVGDPAQPDVGVGSEPTSTASGIESHASGAETPVTTAAFRQRTTPLPGRTLMVLGDLPRLDQSAAALAWAADRGLPVVAEPFGHHPRPAALPHSPAVLADAGFVDAHAPEALLVVGRPTLSRQVAALVRREGIRVVSVSAGLTWRPAGLEVESLDWAEFRAGLRTEPVDEEWASAWHTQGNLNEATFADDPPPWPSMGAVARGLAAALPAEALLFLGSSAAPRALDLAMAPREHPLDIVANRGLAGIDGCVSTAVGLALSSSDRPTYALLGDLTFLHDVGGLLIGPGEPRPDLTIVVANDDGGGIFSTLEPGEPSRAADFERIFGTPTGADLAALCRGYGVAHIRVDTADALKSALTKQPRGLKVVEVPMNRQTARADMAALRDRGLGQGIGHPASE